VYLVLFFGLSVYLGKGRTIGKRVMGIRVVSIVHRRMAETIVIREKRG
jgi:uncharacterized RDD family membrane protein YckC